MESSRPFAPNTVANDTEQIYAANLSLPAS
jgi:hypothetical protein